MAIAAFWELYALERGKSRWSDKTPGHILCAGSIAELLPEARFVHIVRDCRDAICSVRNASFAKDKTLVELAKDWVSRIARFEEQAREFADRTMVVRYEDLVQSAL